MASASAACSSRKLVESGEARESGLGTDVFGKSYWSLDRGSKRISDYVKQKMEMRYGKPFVEEVEYEEIHREETVPTYDNRVYTSLWSHIWENKFSCTDGCVGCAARFGMPRYRKKKTATDRRATEIYQRWLPKVLALVKEKRDEREKREMEGNANVTLQNDDMREEGNGGKRKRDSAE